MRVAVLLRIFVLVFLVGIARIHAARYFSADQVLPPDKTVDLTVWLVDSTDAISANRWGCPAQEKSGFNFSSCLVRPYVHGANPRDQYLYWAFLNLEPNSDRADLAPTTEAMEGAFLSLQRPLLAIKERKDTCLYLVIYRDELAPLAGGRVVCPDLRSGLDAIGGDLKSLANLTPKSFASSAPGKVYRAGVIRFDAPPQTLDLQLEGSMLAMIGLSKDQSPDQNNPYSQGTETFDFKDFADLDGLPFSIRASLLFKDIVGVRLGFTRSDFKMNDGVRQELGSDTSLHGAVLSDWKISRKDYSLELLLGAPFQGNSVELPIYGYLGFAKTHFDETAVIDGKEYANQHLLADVTGLLIGVGGQIKTPYFFLGLEVGGYVKNFEFQHASQQPDGSGSEIQIRLLAGGYARKHLHPEGP